jgi:hypothetical protein
MSSRTYFLHSTIYEYIGLHQTIDSSRAAFVSSARMSFLLLRSQGRRLRFASGGDNYGARSEPNKFFARGGIIHPETAKLAMLE